MYPELPESLGSLGVFSTMNKVLIINAEADVDI
jgi:hypothetical protein